MCGIFLAVYKADIGDKIVLDEEPKRLLFQRGPDVTSQVTFQVFDWKIVLSGYTLWLQGNFPTKQPLVSASGNMLLWNGDAFYAQVAKQSVPDGKADSQFLLEKLEACSSVEEIFIILETIQGPWSIVYFQKNLNTIITGRDKFGRHSLLWNVQEHGVHMKSLFISSVASARTCKEVEASHLYTISLNSDILNICPSYVRQTYIINRTLTQKSEIEELSSTPCPEKILSNYLDAWGNEVKIFEELLTSAIKTRIECQPKLCKNCVKKYLKDKTAEECKHAKIAVLFSGGLDSTILAAVADAVWPNDEPIDLLNVAFPSRTANSADDVYSVPDRVTGQQALQELEQLRPARKWNFIKINVPLEELREMRNFRIASLINPASTVLDDSIGCAQWFAARGEGYLLDSGDEKYTSPARVILMGAGADEQMGGYARHRKRFCEGGWTALINEIEMEVNRISHRNLGRDNRIIADHGRAPRLPYLDERVVDYLATLPIHAKVDLRHPVGVGDKIILRALAHSLGLVKTATEPKRAIQFGSRIAKTETRKEKGSFVCDRLAKALASE